MKMRTPTQLGFEDSFCDINELLKNAPCVNTEEDQLFAEYLRLYANNHLISLRNSLLNAKDDYSRMFPLRLGMGFWKSHDKLKGDTLLPTDDLLSDIERLVKEPWLELFILSRLIQSNDLKVVSFVHVPKCFGSKISRDISVSNSASLIKHYNTIRLNPSWVRPWQRVNDVRALLMESHKIDMLYFSGHISLADLRISGLDRKSSFLFSTIRDPSEIIVSHANYIVTCLNRHPSRPDSQNWKRHCELENIPVESMIESSPDQLAIRIIESDFFSNNYSNLLYRAYAPSQEAGIQDVLNHIQAVPACRVYSIESLSQLYKDLGILKNYHERVNESYSYISNVDYRLNVQSDAQLALTGKDLAIWPMLLSISSH